MIKKAVQRKNKDTTLQDFKNIALSIQFSLDGFSFCITQLESKEILFFDSIDFKETLKNPEELLIKIKEIFKNNKNLQLDFSSVLVVHQNNLSTIVPNKYFDENLIADYLNHNIKTFKTDFFSCDDLEILESKNIYIPYANINNYIFQNFGEFEFKHHRTILLEKLLQLPFSNEKKMYVDVSKSNIDIIVIEKDKVILVNTFNFETKEDFLYYILFVSEQLHLDTNEFELYFTGEIRMNDEYYNICYNYIRNIFFLESSNIIYKKLTLTKHCNYILLG